MIGYEVKDDLRLVKVKRLLGLPIYEKKRTDSRLERSFLGGLYRESVRFADFGEASRQSWLLGLPLWGRTLLGHRLRWHIGRSLVVNSFDILSVLSRDLDRLFASVSVRRVDGNRIAASAGLGDSRPEGKRRAVPRPNDVSRVRACRSPIRIRTFPIVSAFSCRFPVC